MSAPSRFERLTDSECLILPDTLANPARTGCRYPMFTWESRTPNGAQPIGSAARPLEVAASSGTDAPSPYDRSSHRGCGKMTELEGGKMVRAWRNNVRRVMALFIGVEFALLAYTTTVGFGLNAGHIDERVFWFLVSVALAVLTVRGSQLARAVLVVLSAVPLAPLVLFTFRLTPYVLGLAGFGIVEMLLLLAPAHRVARRTHVTAALP